MAVGLLNVRELSRPVIVAPMAGGLATAEAVNAVIAAGAVAAQLGTAFLWPTRRVVARSIALR